MSCVTGSLPIWEGRGIGRNGHADYKTQTEAGLQPAKTQSKTFVLFVSFVVKNQSTVSVFDKFLGKSGSYPRITDM